MVRGEFLTGEARPWLGLGLAYDFGFSGYLKSDYLGTTKVTLGAQTSLLLAGGVAWETRGGLFILTTAGYALSLQPGVGAFYLFDGDGGLGNFFTGSGPIMGLAIGAAF